MATVAAEEKVFMPLETERDIEAEDGGDNKGGTPAHEGESNPLLYKLWELVKVILPAGCYAFGGPTAHLAVFHDLFVTKLHWLNDQEFVDLLALGMILPGPTSSEFCIAVGTYRAGVPGAIVTFVAWTLPSLIIMLLAGLGATHMDPDNTPDWMSGLAPAATVLIFIAFVRLSKKIVTSRLTAVISLVSASITLLVQNDTRIPARAIMWILPLMLVIGGSLTLFQRLREKRQEEALAAEEAAEMAAAAAVAEAGGVDGAVLQQQQQQQEEEEENERTRMTTGTTRAAADADAGAMGSAGVTSDTYSHVPISKRSSVGAVLILVAILLYMLIMDAGKRPMDPLMKVFTSFFIVGITTYGGGQVMLPLLVSVAVEPGWLSMDQFMVGFAIVQMLPGPLSNFAAYIGAIYMGVSGALLGVLGFFLPGMLLVIALLPLWDRLRKVPNIRPFLAGLNATGLGLILAVGIALYLKVVREPGDAVVTIITACMVGYMGYSSFVGVLVGALIGFLLSPTCLNWGQDPYY